MPCNMRFKEFLIELPNSLMDKEKELILEPFKQLLDYKYINYYLHTKKDNLYLTICYLDRDIYYDYDYAKVDSYYYKKSGKRMKKNKYNELNDNHIKIKKGNPIIHLGKKKQYSNCLESLAFYKSKILLEQQKKEILKIIRILEIKYNTTEKYLSVKEYKEKGFKILQKELFYFEEYDFKLNYIEKRKRSNIKKRKFNRKLNVDLEYDK